MVLFWNMSRKKTEGKLAELGFSWKEPLKQN